MTFRIDIVFRDERAGNLTWHFNIKGLQGRGIYCDLKTDESGRGLWVMEEFPDQFVQLLNVDDFEISATATRLSAKRQLAVALTELGWGPEVRD